MSSPESSTADPRRKPRVAYLLADAGIGFWDSKKGCSIHARSMIKAFEQEGCHVDIYVMREGKPRRDAFKVMVVRQSRLTRWWLRRMIDAGLWRRLLLAGPDQRVPNWITAIGWLLWHRDFHRFVARRVAGSGSDAKNRRPDLIYARAAWFSWPYLKLKRLLGVPLFLEVNGVFTIEKQDRGELAFAGLTRRIETEMYRGADKILPVSAEIKQQIVAMGIEPDRVVVTSNAVDLDLFRPVERDATTAPEPFIVGAVNSMRAYHGIGTLLRAAALAVERIPALRLRLIGSGPQFQEMKDLARELGIEAICEFTGTVDHDKVNGLLADCAVCVAPYEGELNQYNCPMKLFEYMALKIPIVASAWGDIPNILKDGETALLHPPADARAFAEALVAVHQNYPAALERARAAHGVACRHTWRSIARRIIDWSREG